MPYKQKGKTVLRQLSSGKWVEEKTHATTKQATQHLLTLRLHVETQEKPKRKKSKDASINQ